MIMRPKRELFRLALHYAIEERQGWLSCVDDDDPYAERARVLVAEWKALLKKEFGQITAEDALFQRYASGEIKSVNVLELIKIVEKKEDK
jgi:hypothetical protein